jgi:hypothetical protein
MKFIIGFVFFLLIIVGCEPRDVEEEFYENGQLTYRVSLKGGLRHGEFKKYYESGELMFISHWNHGVKDGEAVQFFKNGNIQMKEFYHEGLLHGRLVEFDSTSKVISEGYYEYGNLIHDRFFYGDGTLRGDVFANGDTIFSKFFYLNGQVEEVSVKINSILFFGKKYTSEGELVGSNLPIESRFLFEGNLLNGVVDLKYSECGTCYYSFVISNCSDNSEQVVEYFNQTFDEIPLTIEILIPEGIERVCGYFYELDRESGDIIGYMPVDFSFNRI